MILGILIGAVGTFILGYTFFLWVSGSNSKRSGRLHDELMAWHELSLEKLTTRNLLLRDANEILEKIRDKLK